MIIKAPLPKLTYMCVSEEWRDSFRTDLIGRYKVNIAIRERKFASNKALFVAKISIVRNE